MVFYSFNWLSVCFLGFSNTVHIRVFIVLNLSIEIGYVREMDRVVRRLNSASETVRAVR